MIVTVGARTPQRSGFRSAGAVPPVNPPLAALDSYR